MEKTILRYFDATIKTCSIWVTLILQREHVALPSMLSALSQDDSFLKEQDVNVDMGFDVSGGADKYASAYFHNDFMHTDFSL